MKPEPGMPILKTFKGVSLQRTRHPPMTWIVWPVMQPLLAGIAKTLAVSDHVIVRI